MANPADEPPSVLKSRIDLKRNDASQWAYQTKLIRGAYSVQTESLARLQTVVPSGKCHLYCHGELLLSDEDTEIRLHLDPNPLCPHFRLELCLFPLPKNANAAQEELYRDHRMIVDFAAYSPNSGQHRHVQVAYQGPDRDALKPPGPLSFSDQLYRVKHQMGVSELPPGLAHAMPADKRDKAHVFSWITNRFTSYCFDQPVEGEKRLKAVHQFKKIIYMAESTSLMDTKDRLYVIYKPTGGSGPGPLAIRNSAWPYFASMPIIPQSYFPWLYPTPEHPDDFKNIKKGGLNFEIEGKFVQVAFARRDAKGWHEKVSNYDLMNPRGNFIVPLERRDRFRDERQYLAYILGGFMYKELHSQKQQQEDFNGLHICEIFVKDSSHPGARVHVVLLNIHPQASADVAAEAAVLNPGDPVQIGLTWNGIPQIWSGEIVQIPKEFRGMGRNISIKASTLSPIPPVGYIVSSPTSTRADFISGRFAASASAMKFNISQCLIRGMGKEGTDSRTMSDWFKTVLLAQNLYHPEITRSNQTIFSQKRQDHIVEECKARRLTEDQTKVVVHYFSHRLTLVRGPPGNGKSTPVDVITELLEEFKETFWVCAESNSAVDVLVAKTCARHRTVQPERLLRVRTVMEEKLSWTTKDGEVQFEGIKLDPANDTTAAALLAIEALMTDHDVREKVMSLENLIIRRSNAYKRPGFKPLWESEA